MGQVRALLAWYIGDTIQDWVGVQAERTQWWGKDGAYFSEKRSRKY